jgi:hypothetical protein
MDVKIRFNTKYPAASDQKWRIIVDGIEHLVDDIEIKCKSFTSGDLVNVDGQDVMKWHISCKAKNVSFKTKKNKKIAVVL